VLKEDYVAGTASIPIVRPETWLPPALLSLQKSLDREFKNSSNLGLDVRDFTQVSA
jgi:hypothetical protein